MFQKCEKENISTMKVFRMTIKIHFNDKNVSKCEKGKISDPKNSKKLFIYQHIHDKTSNATV